MHLSKFFDRVVVISLRRTAERLATFQERLAASPWPFVQPEVFHAIDGRNVPAPKWWSVSRDEKANRAAHGCFRSHLAVIERALNDGVKRLLVMEDDAQTVDGFCEKAERFLLNLPADWEMAYLGGQVNHYHGHQPAAVNQYVSKPWSVNRMHAYALTTDGMKKVYVYLTDNKWPKDGNAQIQDHRVEKLSRSGSLVTYCPSGNPTAWLMEQGAGYSQLMNRHEPSRDFTEDVRGKLPKVVVVLGPYRSGTSAVAGAIQHLGVSMRPPFTQMSEDEAPKGCFESAELSLACEVCCPEPAFLPALSRQERVRTLHHWLQVRKSDGAVIGAKHPRLCLLTPEMLEAWPDCRIIVVNRQPAACIESLRRVGWWDDVQSPETLITRMITERYKALANVPADRLLHVDFPSLLERPEPAVERLAAFAGIHPNVEQYVRAVAFLSKF